MIFSNDVPEMYKMTMAISWNRFIVDRNWWNETTMLRNKNTDQVVIVLSNELVVSHWRQALWTASHPADHPTYTDWLLCREWKLATNSLLVDGLVLRVNRTARAVTDEYRRLLLLLLDPGANDTIRQTNISPYILEINLFFSFRLVGWYISILLHKTDCRLIVDVPGRLGQYLIYSLITCVCAVLHQKMCQLTATRWLQTISTYKNDILSDEIDLCATMKINPFGHIYTLAFLYFGGRAEQGERGLYCCQRHPGYSPAYIYSDSDRIVLL